MRTFLELFQDQLHTERRDATAIRWIDARQNRSAISFSMLNAESDRRAGYLRSLGCQPGDRVFLFMQLSPEIWYFFWGALKCGAIPCVMFADFGETALKARLETGEANFLVTDSDVERKFPFLESLPSLKQVIHLTFDHESGVGRFVDEKPFPFGFQDWHQPGIESSAFMVFTSGSTGFPKAVVHTHRAAEAVLRSMRDVLGCRADDLLWCTANPAWITGTIYGVIGLLIAGIESVQYSGKFHARRWLPILDAEQVTVWYSAPTAFRSLMATPDDFYHGFQLNSLRAIFSVGEPLNPAVYEWGKRALKHEIYDTWFQTEAGTIRIANRPGDQVIPGWMGKAVDDAQPLILDEDDQICAPGQIGKLVLKTGWDSCFSEYYRNESATLSKFSNGTYRTGDLAMQDECGRFLFIGRDDDVINTSGHLVGPFEVESVLLEDERVFEAGVVSEPDPLLYEKVEAFIVLKPGVKFDIDLENDLKMAVNSKLSGHAVPKAFYPLKALPKNASGKILRNELRARLRGNKV